MELVFLLCLQDHRSEDILCLVHRLFDRSLLEVHPLLAVFASVLPYRLLGEAFPLHPLCRCHNILAVADNFDLAVGIRSLSRHHSCLGIPHHSPASIRHCNHRIRNHPADIDHTVAEDIVEVVVAHNLVEDLVFEPLFRCMVVAAVDSSLDHMPSCC
jgi:hypothetical protein